MTDAKIEEAKQLAGQRAVADHFRDTFEYIGIGSGSTIIYVVDAIKNTIGSNPDALSRMKFVPTGYQSRQVIVQAGLTSIAFDSLSSEQMLDVAFDGADEVDEDLNCIKGGGACLFQEKLVAMRAKRFICVADYRKDRPRLLTNWPSIPIEVAPIAIYTVLRSLKSLGSQNPRVRSGTMQKAGPIKTDQDFFIIDAPFPPLLTASDMTSGEHGDGVGGPDGKKWEVDRLLVELKKIQGVLEVGIFAGPDGDETQRLGLQGGQKPVACYFGMQDGTVKVRSNTDKKPKTA